MASKKNAETIAQEVDQELKAAAQPAAVQPDAESEKDAEIARLRAQLEAAQKQSAGYRSGRDADVVAQAIQEALAAGKDPWTVTVSVRVPERRDTTEKFYWMMVNGRSVQLPANNQYQEMKLPFAETLMRTLQAERYAQSFAENEIKVYDPLRNPHEQEDVR